MSAAASLEQRIDELVRLRNRIDDEVRRLNAELARSQPKRPKRPRHVIPECGTESAYQRHRWRGEPQDDACKKAHAQHTAQTAARRRLLKRLEVA